MSVDITDSMRKEEIKHRIWFFALLVSLFGATVFFAVRSWMMNILSYDSTKGITPPSYVTSGSILILWYLWAVFSLAVVVSLIFWLGGKE